jgi:hypothetical protein
MDQGAVEVGQPGKVKLLDRLGGTKLRAAQPYTKLPVAPRHLVGNKHGLKLGIGQFRFNSLAVSPNRPQRYSAAKSMQ